MADGVEVTSRLGALDGAGVAEVAEVVLTRRLGAEDLEQAAARLAAALTLPPDQVAELAREALGAADANADAAVALLRIGLAEAAAENDAMRAQILAAAENAGRKQLVIGPEWLGLGVLLVLGYVAAKGGGQQSLTEKMTIETNKDGRLKVTREKRVVYIDPFSALGKLVKRMLGQAEGSDSGTPPT
jgi:hypothetical protein